MPTDNYTKPIISRELQQEHYTNHTEYYYTKPIISRELQRYSAI